VSAAAVPPLDPGAEDDGLGRGDPKLLKRFLPYLRTEAPAFAASLLLLFSAGALELAGPYLTKIAIDEAIPRRDGAQLGKIVLVYLALLGVGFAVVYAQTLLVTRAGQRVMMRLRKDLFAHLLKMDLATFDRNAVGRLVTRVTSDVESLNELLSSGLVSILGDFITLTGITIVLFLLDARLALLCFMVLPLAIATSLVFRRRARRGFRETRERVARLNSILQETFSGIEVVRLFGKEKDNDVLFERENAKCRDAWLETLEAFAIFFPVIQLLLTLSLATILGAGGMRVLEGTLTLGALVAFLQYVQRFFAPLRDLSEKYNVLQSALASSERIFGVLDWKEEDSGSRLPPFPPLRGDIEFENVSFSYVEGEPVLHDVSFRVNAGERVAIVGATGSGKTTILSLLLGFYRPSRGRILIDGLDLERHDVRSLRRQTGTVLQDVFLFSADVSWNLRLGDESVDAERIEHALDFARARRFVSSLPRQLDEVVGERGRALSVGQRQLLSIARAAAADPALLLLDEATSSVDSETEALVQEAFATRLQGRTSIVVAHRLSTVRDADRILVMHHGRLVEQGTHRQLIARDGVYSKLVELQFGSEKLEASTKA
jgi:ATP-binding cassette subfamily B protein